MILLLDRPAATLAASLLLAPVAAAQSTGPLSVDSTADTRRILLLPAIGSAPETDERIDWILLRGPARVPSAAILAPTTSVSMKPVLYR